MECQYRTVRLGRGEDKEFFDASLNAIEYRINCCVFDSKPVRYIVSREHDKKYATPSMSNVVLRYLLYQGFQGFSLVRFIFLDTS